MNDKSYKNANFIKINIRNQNFRLTKIRKDNGKTFLFWTNAKTVFDFIWGYLLNKFPDDLLMPEIDRVDILNLSKNLPIEIQSTIVYFSEKTARINHALFYSHITSQIKPNIEKYGKCWFFFDWEYFNFIKDGLGKHNKFNPFTFFNQFDPDSLRVFLVRFNGDIKEIPLKEFEHLAEGNDTNPVEENMKIFYEVLKHYKFTTNEIKKYRDEYLMEGHKHHHFRIWLQVRKGNDRAVLLGNIINGLMRLGDINLLFDRKKKPFKNWITYTSSAARALGIIFYNQETRKYGFSDHFSICKYFPAYQQNKAFWDDLNGKSLNIKQFNEIVFNKGASKLEDFN